MSSLFPNLRSRLLPGVIAALLVASLFKLSSLQPLEQIAYNALFQLRGPLPWDDRIVAIGIDESSLKKLGRFPWSRQHYATLFNILSRDAPSVVVLNILLAERSPEDRQLAEAMQRQGYVVIAQSWDSTGHLLLPTPELLDAAIAVGHVFKQQDTDGLTRQIIPQIYSFPALGVAAVQVYGAVSEAVNLPDLTQPLFINWPGPLKTLPQYSFVDVVEGRIPASTFQGKIVLVGPTAAALDSLSAPFDRNPPASGIYLHAATINNILQQNFLQKPDDRYLLLILLGAGPGFSYLIAGWSVGRRFFAWAIACCGWGLLSFALFKLGWYLPVASPIILFGLTAGHVALYEQIRINTLLKESEERYSLAVRGSNEGLWDWNLQRNEIYFSPRWKEMLGFFEHQIGTSSDEWLSRVHPQDCSLLKAEIVAHLTGETLHFECEYRMLHQDGTYRWMLCRGMAVWKADGTPYRMVGSQTDITERKRAEEQLLYNAFHDPLTGLVNRAFLFDRLEAAIERVKTRRPPWQLAGNSNREPALFAVLFLDLDRFKLVNDSLGHRVGDELLKAIARRLETCVRTGDIVARLGGDEFTVLLENIQDVSEAAKVADRIHEVLAFPFYPEGHEVFTAVSIGITLSSVGYERPAELLRDADIAMYRAKAQGKARSKVFHPAMHLQAVAQLQLETDLRRAIERQEFRVYYQPIVSLTETKIMGFEALVRWQHRDRGLVSPAEFIPLAEETGLITSLGWWVLSESCRQMAVWHRQFPNLGLLTMSVNLSGVQFSQADLFERIDGVLVETGLEGSSLKLEITESVIMANAELAITLMDRLRDRGVQLSIDDFGTGYSSLGRLHSLPIHTLKIDRSFVRDMERDDGMEIIRAIVALAHNLGLDIVAEGVETTQQFSQLQALGCEYGQGYLFSKAVDSEVAAELLSRQKLVN